MYLKCHPLGSSDCHPGRSACLSSTGRSQGPSLEPKCGAGTTIGHVHSRAKHLEKKKTTTFVQVGLAIIFCKYNLQC